LILSFGGIVHAQNYYSKSTGNPNTASTWGTNTDGTGTAPVNFTSAAQVFTLSNGNPGVLAANWTVSGLGSKVVVGDGITTHSLNTAAFTVSGLFDVANNGTLNIQSASTFTLGTCATGSTVNYAFDGTQNVMPGTYYHLTLSNASASRTKTATGAITVNGDLAVNTNHIFAMSTFQLLGVNGLISGNGTITTLNTSSAPIPAGKSWSQNIIYSSSSSQTVVKGIFNLALNVAGASGSRVFPTGGDTIEVKGSFTANGTSITYTTAGTRFVFSGAAQTLTFSTTSVFNFGYVLMTGTSIAKTIATAGFNADTLNIANSVTLNMATFALGGSLNSIAGAGAIQTQNTGATPLPGGKTWTQSVNYNGATQTIVSGTYPNLTYAAGNKTASGDIVVNTVLTSTGNLDLQTYLLSGGFTNSGTGTITTANTAAIPIPVGKTWTQNIAYSSTGSQTVVSGIYTLALNIAGGNRVLMNNGTIEVRGAFTANTVGAVITTTGSAALFSTATQVLTFGATTINFSNISFTTSTFTKTIAGGGFNADTLNVATGVILNMATFALGGTLTGISGAGTIQTACAITAIPAGKTWTQNITYNSSSSQAVVSGIYTLALNIAGGNRVLSNNGIIEVRGAFTANTVGALVTTTGSSVVFSTATQLLTFGATTINFSNIAFTTATFTKTIAGGGFNADTLNVASGVILNMATFALGGALTNITGPGTIQTQNISSTPLPAGKFWTQNITYNSASAQTVVKGIYAQALNVIGAGRTFPSGGDTIEVRGNFSATTASITYTTAGTRFVFSGSAQTLTFVSTSAFNFGYVLFTGNGVTKTISGAGFNVDTLNIAPTVTLNMAALVMGGNMNLSIGNGTIQTQAAATAVPINKTWAQNFIYDFDGTQAIVGGTYPNLTISILTTARVKTATGNITVNNELALISTGAGSLGLSMSTFKLSDGGSFTLTNSGAAAKNVTTLYTNTDTAFKPLPVNQTWPGSVTYSSATHQTVVSGIYIGSLALAGGSRTFSAMGVIECRAAFLPSGTSVTYATAGSSFLFSGGAQTLTFSTTSAFNFNNVSFTGSNVVKTIAIAGFGVNGVLTIDTTTSVNMVTFAMSGNPSVISGAGIIITQNVSVAPLPAYKSWTQTVNYNSGSNQNIIGGQYANLTLSSASTSSRTKTALDSITVNRNLTLTTTSTGVMTLAMGVYRLIDGGNFLLVNSGATLKTVITGCTNTDTVYKPIPANQTWPGIVNYSSGGHQTVVPGVYTNTLSVAGGSRTFLASGTIEVRGAFTANTISKIYTAAGTTFLFSGAAQTLTFVSSSPFNFNNVSFAGSNTKLIAGVGFGVNGTLNISNGVTLNMVTFNITGNPTGISGDGILLTQSSSAAALPLNKTWTQTVNYNVSGNQSIIGGTYAKLMISNIVSNTRIKTATGNITVMDSFTLNASATGIITLEMLAFRLIAGPTFKFINLGTTARNINTQNLDPVPIPSNITWPSTVTITYNAASGTQIVSKGVYTHLKLSGNASKVAEGSMIVRGILTLTSPNASATKGSLHMGNDTLLMDDVNASFAGTGDLTGIVKRTGTFVPNTQYTFGNLYTSIKLSAGGNIPSEISMRIKLGSSLINKTNSITRQYEIAQVGGTDTAIIQFHYLVSELNGIVETRLVVWEDSLGAVNEKGRSAINTTNKFVEASGIRMANYASTFGSSYTGLAATAQAQVVWVGQTSTSWSTISNWDPTFVPDSTDDVIIPDASTTIFDPLLPATARVKTISLDENSVLNSPTSAQLFVYGGTTLGLSSWDCNGVFNASTSTVTFLGSDATFAGATNFYNVNIVDTAILSNRESSMMGIGNAITNTGIWRVAAFNETTVEYNKNGSQTVLKPNGITVPGYFNLKISGSGTKTFPDSVGLKGDFINSGTVVIDGLRFNGTTDQLIQSTTPLTMNSLRINNKNHVTTNTSLTLNDSLALISGILEMNGNDLTVNGLLSGSGSVSTNAAVDIIVGGSGDAGVLRFTNDADTLGSLTINRIGGGSIELGSGLILNGALTLTNGNVKIGANELVLNGGFSGSLNNRLSANGISALYIGGSGALGNLFFDQSIPGTTNRLSNLTYNRNSQTITLGNVLEIGDSIVPVAGVFASAGNLTLCSNALKTARIGTGNCNSCSYITGSVTVQRYVPALTRRWRFIGNPVAANTIADWQNEVYITGPGGAANGFDATLSNFAGIYSYNESVITGTLNTGWTVPANTSQAIGLGKGYRIFIRGDRSDTGRLNGSITTQNAVTINAVGVPNQGDVSMPVTCTFSNVGPSLNEDNDGWNLLANPYASAYNWDAHYNDGSFQTNLEPTVWVFNAQSNGYVSYNASSQTGDLTNGIIPSGASFWVKANDASPGLTFKEQFKAADIPLGLFKTDDGENFKITLFYDSINSDAATVKYVQGMEEGFDKYDSRKLEGAVTISTFGRDSVKLGINVRPTTFDVDTIGLSVGTIAATYRLIFTNSDKIAIKDHVWLFDTYLSTVTDLQTTSVYPFTIMNGVAASGGVGRFYILIGDNTLPVKLVQFTAQKKNNEQVSLHWTTAQEINSNRFEIERSVDAKVFEFIGEVSAKGISSRIVNYIWEDYKPNPINYYRLKQVDADGSFHYSETRLVKLDEGALKSFVYYPIPAKETITIEHAQPVKNIRVLDITGTEIVRYSGNNYTETINIQQLAPGVYILSISDETGKTLNEKFVKE
jgi:hypothetical protein